MSQTDTSSAHFLFLSSPANRLISLTLPLFIRKTFDNTPVLPFDIVLPLLFSHSQWTIEFARSTLQLPSNQFNSILKDCGVNPANFAELLEAMGITALSRPACVPLSVSDSLCRFCVPLLSRFRVLHLPLGAPPLAPQVRLARCGGDGEGMCGEECVIKVAKEGDGVIKVAKEGDGVIKVAKEDDGVIKVAKEDDGAA